MRKKSSTRTLNSFFYMKIKTLKFEIKKRIFLWLYCCGDDLFFLLNRKLLLANVDESGEYKPTSIHTNEYECQKKSQKVSIPRHLFLRFISLSTCQGQFQFLQFLICGCVRMYVSFLLSIRQVYDSQFEICPIRK